MYTISFNCGLLVSKAAIGGRESLRLLPLLLSNSIGLGLAERWINDRKSQMPASHCCICYQFMKRVDKQASKGPCRREEGAVTWEFPNSCGKASHFDDVSRVCGYSETLKGCLCFLLNLLLSVCLPRLLTLHSLPSVKVFFEWEHFWLRHWLLPHHPHPVLHVITNYSPPPFLRPLCNSIFAWNQRGRFKRTLEAQIETVQDDMGRCKDVQIQLTLTDL